MKLQERKIFYSDIPQNTKICIWGCASAGISVKEDIERFRKDLEVTVFVDSSRQGEIDGVKIIKPSQISEVLDRFDYMIISTRSDATVIDAFLFYYNINNYKRISKELLKTYQFIPSKLEKVMSILDSEEDKSLFYDLIEARITDNTEKIKQYVFQKHNITYDRKRTIKHYTSYINYDAIEVILEGGMFNGLNTIIFKKLFKNLKKIYAFELIYDSVKNKTISHIIDGMKELEIVKYAMWHKKDKINFVENVSMPYSSGLNPAWNRNDSEKTYSVDSISIDEFVDERNLTKVDFIKMDIEGAELNALRGAFKTLLKKRPQLAISIYHSNNDMIEIPLYLAEILENYTFKIGQYSPDNDETILYAIPNELYRI